MLMHVMATDGALARLSSDLDTKSNIADVSAMQLSIGNILASKQNVIADDHLAISHVASLQSRLDGLQPTVTAGSLDIPHIDGLEYSIDSKQAIIGNGDIQIAHVSGLNEAFGNFIPWGSIGIADVTGLAPVLANGLDSETAASTYQPIITSNSLVIDHVSGLQAKLDEVSADIGTRVMSTFLTSALADYMKVGDVDADVMGLSDSIASISSELDEKISSTDADKRFHPKIAANELPTSSVNGLFQFIFDTNMKLNLMQIDLNLKSNVRALESYQPLVTTNTLPMSVIAGLVDHVIQTGMALAAMTEKINALTVVPQHSVLLSSTVNLPN